MSSLCVFNSAPPGGFLISCTPKRKTMTPDAVTTTNATSLLDRLPPELVGPVIFGLIVWWLTRNAYRETSRDRGALLDRLESRLNQTETALAEVSQIVESKDDRITDLTDALAELRVQLAASQAAEHSCVARIERLEARYEARIAELEHEIVVFRVRLGEVSESYLDD